MRKKRHSENSEPYGLFRLLLSLLNAVFLISLARGIWHYRRFPDVIPPLIPVLWPFSVPLPRFFYLLLPLISGTILSGYRVLERKAGTTRFTGHEIQARLEAPSKKSSVEGSCAEARISLDKDWKDGRKASMEEIRWWLSQARVSGFFLQVIAVSLYAYVQESLLARITGRSTPAFFLMHVHGWILVLSLGAFLISIIIRMYRKNHGLS